jgi:hypothetical protein
MKASKVEEVGQMRRRRGISMKIRTRPETLDVFLARGKRGGGMEAYRHSMLKMMRRTPKWKMLAMPRAMQRMMQRTPVLWWYMLVSRTSDCAESGSQQRRFSGHRDAEFHRVGIAF